MSEILQLLGEMDMKYRCLEDSDSFTTLFLMIYFLLAFH